MTKNERSGLIFDEEVVVLVRGMLVRDMTDLAVKPSVVNAWVHAQKRQTPFVSWGVENLGGAHRFRQGFIRQRIQTGPPPDPGPRPEGATNRNDK